MCGDFGSYNQLQDARLSESLTTAFHAILDMHNPVSHPDRMSQSFCA